MDLSSLNTLEYTKVLKVLGGFASTPQGGRLVHGLRPLKNLSAVEEAFRDYLEIQDHIRSAGTLPLAGISELEPLFKKAAPDGAWLLPEELKDIRTSLEVIKGLGAVTDRDFSRRYPGITRKIGSLSDYSGLLREIDRVLDERGDIRDDASAELLSIRQETGARRKRARTILDGLVRERSLRGLFQDEPVTIRDDRYVVAVRAGGHAKIKGVIHGRSATGATYFIEPFELVEVNNSLAVLKKEEMAEEIRILKALTLSVLARKDDILKDLHTVAELDLLQAKALFARRLGCVVPEIKAGGGVKFIGARHPLLVIREIEGRGRAVPVDIIIDEGTKVLVISGANTGGKTVALKTLGLLTLMVQSAIPVPVREGSSTVYFKDVFADIGDRQDILASLSTFSSHLKEVKRFLSHARPGALVLIDEIGVGTDPAEGAALALSVLEAFKERGAFTVVTTHLNLLKAHALKDPSFKNASVEFDEKTLKPLYRLCYNVPGPSLGLSIARDFGIPSEIVERARKSLDDREASFLESIRSLEEERARLEAERKRLEELRFKREKALERLREDRDRLVQRAREKMDSIIKRAEDEAKRTIEELRKAGLREKEVRELKRTIEGLKEKNFLTTVKERTSYVPEPGDTVELSSRTKGVVLRVDSEERRAELAVGSLRVRVPYERLKRCTSVERPRKRDAPADLDVEAGASINIVGMRVDEALRSVERFLDHAHVKGLQSVEIIHGTGTGALKRAVEGLLRDSPLVKGFCVPHISTGGVTRVELR